MTWPDAGFHLHSSLMFCRASTATVFTSCLFLRHFPFSFVWKLTWFMSGDWLGHCIPFYFFALKICLVAFVACFRSSSICTVWTRFGFLGLNISPSSDCAKHFQIHPVVSVSSHIINKYQLAIIDAQLAMKQLGSPLFHYFKDNFKSGMPSLQLKHVLLVLMQIHSGGVST